MMLDDKAENVLNSIADYSVLVRRPWNSHMTGMLSANNYREFLAMVERIERNRYEGQFKMTNDAKIIALVGPSGSGKTAIAKKLSESPLFAVPRSTTTRAHREGKRRTLIILYRARDSLPKRNRVVSLRPHPMPEKATAPPGKRLSGFGSRRSMLLCRSTSAAPTHCIPYSEIRRFPFS